MWVAGAQDEAAKKKKHLIELTVEKEDHSSSTFLAACTSMHFEDTYRTAFGNSRCLRFHQNVQILLIH